MKKSIEFLEIESVYKRDEKAPKLPVYMPLVRFLIGILSRIFPKTTANIAFQQFRTPRFRAKHKIKDNALKTAKIKTLQVGANLLKTYTWGNGDKNVLLIHGWESRGTALRAFVKPLVGNGFRVVAFDLPAHGDSSGKRSNSMEAADAVASIINHLGSVDAVITHSFGGMVVALASRKLLPNQPIPKAIMLSVPLRFDAILLKIKKMMNFSGSTLETVREIIFRIAGEYPIDMNIRNAAHSTQIEQLLIIHDKKDPIVDFKYAKEIHEAWANSTLVATDGLGHYRIMKNLRVVNRAVDFILN